MNTSIQQTIQDVLGDAVNTLKQKQVLPEDWQNKSQLSRTKDPSHGDFASNIAMTAAKVAGTNPRALASLIVEALPDNDAIAKVDIAGPGFINFFLKQENRFAVLDAIIAQGQAFGKQAQQSDDKVIVEFVSANPTGPLHVGHGRQAALGDAICNLLSAIGKQVHKEFYYNDAGVQINNLGLSVQSRAKGIQPDDEAWPEAGYRGEYIQDIATAYLAKATVKATDRSITATGDVDDLDNITDFAVTYLRHEQDLDLQAFNLTFDEYYLESSLYDTQKVDDTVKILIDAGKTYEKDGALWLKTTDYGDDKDRVMRKSDTSDQRGGYTYFVPDIAYHIEKWRRGYTKAINIQGTDHHGTIARVRAGLQAVGQGIAKGYPDYILHTMVRVVRGGQEVKISKRSGSYITLRDLIEWTSKDAVRFFLLSRKPDTEYTFDVDLALEKNNDNPVFYLQYAHARVCRLFGNLPERGLVYDADVAKANYAKLTHELETELLKKLSAFPEQILKAATSHEPHLMTVYLRDLVAIYHSWYDKCRVLPKEGEPHCPDTMQARLTLNLAIKQVIANGLALLGVSAPEAM